MLFASREQPYFFVTRNLVGCVCVSVCVSHSAEQNQRCLCRRKIDAVKHCARPQASVLCLVASLFACDSGLLVPGSRTAVTSHTGM